jgi:outer membrane protein assembly factor BamB
MYIMIGNKPVADTLNREEIEKSKQLGQILANQDTKIVFSLVPNEILLYLFNFLEGKELSSLALTSKRFYSIVALLRASPADEMVLIEEGKEIREQALLSYRIARSTFPTISSMEMTGDQSIIQVDSESIWFESRSRGQLIFINKLGQKQAFQMTTPSPEEMPAFIQTAVCVPFSKHAVFRKKGGEIEARFIETNKTKTLQLPKNVPETVDALLPLNHGERLVTFHISSEQSCLLFWNVCEGEIIFQQDITDLRLNEIDCIKANENYLVLKQDKKFIFFKLEEDQFAIEKTFESTKCFHNTFYVQDGVAVVAADSLYAFNYEKKSSVSYPLKDEGERVITISLCYAGKRAAIFRRLYEQKEVIYTWNHARNQVKELVTIHKEPLLGMHVIGLQVIIATSSRIFALDRRNGKELWTSPPDWFATQRILQASGSGSRLVAKTKNSGDKYALSLIDLKGEQEKKNH